MSYSTVCFHIGVIQSSTYSDLVQTDDPARVSNSSNEYRH